MLMCYDNDLRAPLIEAPTLAGNGLRNQALYSKQRGIPGQPCNGCDSRLQTQSASPDNLCTHWLGRARAPSLQQGDSTRHDPFPRDNGASMRIAGFR